MESIGYLVTGLINGVIITELLICIVKMFIDAKNTKEESRLLDEMMKNDLEAHHATLTVMNDMANRLNVVEKKLGIEYNEENEEEEEE